MIKTLWDQLEFRIIDVELGAVWGLSVLFDNPSSKPVHFHVFFLFGDWVLRAPCGPDLGSLHETPVLRFRV